MLEAWRLLPVAPPVALGFAVDGFLRFETDVNVVSTFRRIVMSDLRAFVSIVRASRLAARRTAASRGFDSTRLRRQACLQFGRFILVLASTIARGLP